MTRTRFRTWYAQQYGGAGAGQDHADEMMAADALEEQERAGADSKPNPTWLQIVGVIVVWICIVSVPIGFLWALGAALGGGK